MYCQHCGAALLENAKFCTSCGSEKFEWIISEPIFRNSTIIAQLMVALGLSNTQPGQVKKNRIVNGLAIVLGFLSGKPAKKGAGLIADTKQVIFIEWNNIENVEYEPKQHVIIQKGVWTEKIPVVDTKENYGTMETEINDKTPYQAKLKRIK